MAPRFHQNVELHHQSLCVCIALRKNCLYSEFLWSVFSRIRTEYRDLQTNSPYLVRIQENMDHKTSEYEHFSHNALHEQTCFIAFLLA